MVYLEHIVRDCVAVQVALEIQEMMPGLQPKVFHCISLELLSLGVEDPAVQHMHSVARTIESYPGTVSSSTEMNNRMQKLSFAR